ncbi:hypothetical protein ACYJ1Y_18405 [Natrialbaceae archaeon A-gly3]
MSDERSDGGDGDGSPTDENAGAVSPGGGPKRVVSEQSVDDILESLSETKGNEPDPSSQSVDEQAREKDEVDEPSGVGYEDDTDLELEADSDLEARIESGEVTGADVRAAEAGEGREPTPAVDEIDLTLEDVERTSQTESEREDSTQSDSGGRNTEATDGDAEDEGLLARIRRLFSR